MSVGSKRGRRAKQPRRGLVLGAGGVLGAAWMTGALVALRDELGLDATAPDAFEVVVGTSAGSVLGALAGSGYPLDVLLQAQRGSLPADHPAAALDLDHATGGSLPPRPRLVPGSPDLLLRALRSPRRHPPGAVISSLLPLGRGSFEPVRSFVQNLVGLEWPTTRELWLVAMDYDSGRRVALGREGSPRPPLPTAVMASCAIPGWYEPVRYRGRRYVDGGMCSVTSADLLAAMGLDEVCVLAPMAASSFDHPTNWLVRGERRYRHAVNRRLARESAKVAAGGTTVVTLAPTAEDLAAMGANLMDPRRRLAVLEASLRTSAATLRASGSDLSATG